MRDTMPVKPWKIESGIVNLDTISGPGTHWVCYKKLDDSVYYFDSFGNLPPPKEVMQYFRGLRNIFYNVERKQNLNAEICGHLCLEFLANGFSI